MEATAPLNPKSISVEKINNMTVAHCMLTDIHDSTLQRIEDKTLVKVKLNVIFQKFYLFDTPVPSKQQFENFTRN